MTDFDATSPSAYADVQPAEVASNMVKRLLDMAVAGLALLLLAPLLLLVGAAIKVESPGPMLFRQSRTGLGGRRFTIFKFRSMYVMEDGGAVKQATKSDARVTRVGRIIRALSIDELPQLLNILRGEMSLVGPRPHALSHDASWSATVSGYDDRFRARPGLTGYAQIRGYRGEVLDRQAIADRVAADNFYIDNWTLGLELKILLLTVPLLFNDPNAY